MIAAGYCVFIVRPVEVYAVNGDPLITHTFTHDFTHASRRVSSFWKYFDRLSIETPEGIQY